MSVATIDPSGWLGFGTSLRQSSVLGSDYLGNKFHEMFRYVSDPYNRKKTDKKKIKKKTKGTKIKEKRKGKCTSAPDLVAFHPPIVEIFSNPSSFAAFTGVRQSVLEKQIRDAAQLYIAANVGHLSDSESDDEEEKNKETPIRVPKIVGIGLCSVFEIIRESHHTYPSICMRSLQALLDMLQGQQPEGLKSEPSEVIDALFNQLLYLTTSHALDNQSRDSQTRLTSLACACLLSLVIARGDTGKLLSATAAILMSPRKLAMEEIEMPGVLNSLQQSVHAVLLGKIVRPDWLTHGMVKKSLIDSFPVRINDDGANVNVSSIASDGCYLYIHCETGLYKISSGYGETIRGTVVVHRPDFHPNEKGWLGYAQGRLYFKSLSAPNSEIVVLDRDLLKEKEIVFPDGKEWGPNIMFSDGQHIGHIASTKDDSFIVRLFNPNVSPMPCVGELPLKLARKCLDVFGYASFDEETNIHTINIGTDEEPGVITAGKEFALIRTNAGKIIYSGKSQFLGIKQGNALPGRWNELPLTKSPKIIQHSIGHEGVHALLVSEDGTVYFAGTARRGEDGDQSKGRRPPKPVKPKKIMKMDGLNVVYSACNNGSSALITKDGELYIFGKDTAHCENTTGQVTDLKDAHISQVALGKAHVVALTNSGQLYTFGINNKGQCGRDFSCSHSREALSVTMATTNEEECEDEELEQEETEVMCMPGKHKWKHDQCMVCTVCGECTGYGSGCISNGRPDRNPGLLCGCGSGDSGCAECGCCRTCAHENIEQDSESAAFCGNGVSGILDMKVRDMIRLDLIIGGRQGARLQDQLQRRFDERRHRHKTKHTVRPKIKGTKTIKTEHPPDKGPLIPLEDAMSSDQERDASKITSLPPGRVPLPFDSAVTQVSCGLHHTILLTETGDVYTFGSNQYGQLGLGDHSHRGTPTLVKLSQPATHVAAGSNHSVVLVNTGQVYSFGNHQKFRYLQKGQLGRCPPNNMIEEVKIKEKNAKDLSWYTVPGLVPNVGPKHGRRATWVGASCDQTFIKIDESLINPHSLSRSSIIANNTSIGLIPSTSEHTSFKCLIINKSDGNCRSFSDADHVDFTGQSACLDPLYNVLWSHNPQVNQVNCYNVIASEAQRLHSDSASMPDLLSPELALPTHSHSHVSCSHAALHLLGCLDTLTICQERNMQVQEDDQDRQNVARIYSKEDFVPVNRFESHGGGWGYSGHSIEAIRFMADTDLLLGGFGLFGGRGEYTGKIKLFDIGMDGGDQETDGELLAETEEVLYECGARQKYPMLFDEPIPLQANRWYVAWARVSGPSSDCGSSGQSVVTTEDQVIFYFKSSKKSNNGTDVNAGQIPQLLYRVITPESQATNRHNDRIENVYILSQEFSRTVTPDCFQPLLQLLQWSWQTFKVSVVETHQMQDLNGIYTAVIMDLERLVYISTASLRLIRTYINEVYPNIVSHKAIAESLKLAECAAEVRALLRRILSDNVGHLYVSPRVTLMPKLIRGNSKPETTFYSRMFSTILDECHQTFVSCFHAFYPSGFLKWSCLCDLLTSMDNLCSASSSKVTNEIEGCDRLLAAVLASLSSPTVKLTSIFPITYEFDNNAFGKQISSVENSVNNIENSAYGEPQRYPLLVEHMNYRCQVDGMAKPASSFCEVLDQLLAIITKPVQQLLSQERLTYSSRLVANACNLLAAVVAELASQTTGNDAEFQNASGRILQVTPSRFTRTNQSRTWNTGNGSPDAICFSVDRPGIVIAGVCVYGGVGFYDYELELLDDQSGNGGDGSHTQRWTSLEIVRGTFGPDDCIGDIAEIKFDRPVPIKEHVKYALRLRNHGGRTSNGDGGVTSVKAPDGTTFRYSACSLSFNGTNHTRGQIPQILYYSTPQDSESQQSTRALAELQARKGALSMTSSIVKMCTDLLTKAQGLTDKLILEAVGSAHIISLLLPLILAQIGPVAASDPRSAVQVMSLIQDLLPPVASINNQLALHLPILPGEQAVNDTNLCTSSYHYAVVESDHPYKPVTVAHYRVAFPESVKWVSLEFDTQCGTAQAEDSLQLYIPSREMPSEPLLSKTRDDNEVLSNPYWPILRKFSGTQNWPHNAIILPGNEVIFSLETASDYVKDDKACFYGFKCLVVGYEWTKVAEEGLKYLEKELAYLGGTCAASLMKKDLLLPPVSVDEMEDDLEMLEEIAQQVYNSHSALLSKGFALSHCPTIHQALEGMLPFNCHFNERSFLKDFVTCASGTSGGRLARWLQPDSYIDPKQCEVIYLKDEIKCGWPAVITVVTKDQYGNPVHVPNLRVEVKAIPIDKKDRSSEDSNCKIPRISKPDSMTFGGHPYPNLETQYEVTVKDKMCYNAISMMKAYENYSFEELRYMTPAMKRPSENMMVRANNDSTYSASWTPSTVGWYSIHATVDGTEIDEVYKAEVKETPLGLTPPSQNLAKKISYQPNKIRKFVSSSSAGLRIRAHPSLQSEQIGIVHVNGTVCFLEELRNDDGVWLHLSPNTVKKYCMNGQVDGWCLQYNQHLGKTLLVPVEEPKSLLDQIVKENVIRKAPESGTKENRTKQRRSGPGIYHVVKCGASGHNIRSRPSLKAPPVGMLVLNNQINVSEDVINSEGVWVKLDKESMRRYCFNTDGEAWSLSLTSGDTMYLQHENDLSFLEQQEDKSDVDNGPPEFGNSDPTNGANQTNGFDFSSAAQKSTFTPFSGQAHGAFSFGATDKRDGTPSDSPSPFVFGLSSTPSFQLIMSSKSTNEPFNTVEQDCTEREQSSRLSVLQRWLKEEELRQERTGSSPRDIPPELLGVNVKELVKAIGESRANGNGVTPPRTPPGTPRRMSRSSSPLATTSPHLGSRESSPVPGGKGLTSMQEHITSSPVTATTILSGAFPLASNQDSRNLNPVQRKGSLQIEHSIQLISTSTGNVESHLENLGQTNFQKDGENNSAACAGKEVIQTGTQTSPDGLAGHFNIGSGNNKDEPHLSPKHGRKERSPRTLRSKRERAMSPAPLSKDKTQRENLKEPVKVALSPSVAECLRAVFASLLWHEGITHDAMACASFLKFQPNLPKQAAQVKRREYAPAKADALTKEQKARQRHSVEVSTYSYLNIQPNSTEGLTKCYLNANVNKNKMRKTSESIKEEGTIPDKQPNTDESCATSKSQPDVGGHSFSDSSLQSGGLPPSLQHLVTLWEELVSACLRAIAQQIILPSPTIPIHVSKIEKKEREREKDKRNKKKKDWKPIGVGRGNLFGEAAGSPFTGSERETVCELCGFYSPHPVTYHMKQAHPGCGGHAGGKGYNSSGNFCGGWAGNCGDGGVGGSSWYLICDRCREKYLKQKRQLLMKEKSKKSKKKFSPNKVMSPLSQIEVHHIMKNNAMFLLDLASASSTHLPSRSVTSHKKSPYRNNMPSLNEHSPLDASPFPPIPFQCLRTLGMQPSELNMLSEDFLLEESLRQNNDVAIGRTTSDIGSRLSSADMEGQLGTSGNGEVTSTSDSEINRGRVGFHRSISVGTTGREWNKHEGESRVIMTRKRNNSSGECSDTGSSLLCHPSSNLTKLVSLIMDKNHAGEILNRPIMAFILQRHDLESLQLTMRQALRKGACRVFALQALNWLIRSVTQPTALHDLMWCFVAALSPVTVETVDEDEDGEKKEKKDSEQNTEKERDNICEHPLSDITIAGDAVHPLLTTFHSLLQTISDLMMLLPMGSALQQMAMRCWCLKFHQSDHLFLHRSHVFSNISKILSRSEEELGTDEASSTMGDSFQVTSVVECLKDLTSDCEMKASSRQAMIGSLMDNSTETFWESGDEDRNKTKMITVCSSARAIPKMVYVHIDNCRDLGNKVSSVTFKAGSTNDDQVKLKYSEIESRYTGWVCCPIVDNKHHILRLEFKGPDNTLRLRQIKVLGEIEGESITSGKLHSSMVIQQKNCEAETLKVFRMLTSQVFGKLIAGDDTRSEQREYIEDNQKEDNTKPEGNNDLKEHMVGILFSRSKLTHLQKQVCTHIVQAIRKEAIRVREEWEALLCSKSLSMDELPKSSDAYCFEMLSMVLALSGSSVGRAYLAQQHTLLRDLLSLLHTGSARVQRQVTSLLKRVLPDVSPQNFANILSVPSLPPKDFSIITEAGKSPQEQDHPLDIHKMGILDVFLSCIAKALTVQMKIKGKESGKGITTSTLATAIHPRDNLGARWWLRGCLTRKLAEVIIQLLIDMAAGKLSEAWANVTKGAIAENVLNLTKLDEKYRIPSECLKTPTLWLALASLCVLDQEHVERLSSGQWLGSGEGQQAQPRPLCENHDDGETLAIILCSVCGNLCADCDRFLHLHRRTRSHQRQVFKEEEEAIKVDLHEGCGRTKLFWIMALADSKTLKAMIEFREGNRGKPTSSTLGTCRFCGTTGNTGLLAIGNVCADAECQEHARNTCTKTLPCGHTCGGIINENPCLPCLHGCSGDLSLKQDADDMCMICFTEALACAPAAQLKCGHVFHLHCCCTVIKRRWSGPRITFGFSLCPICKTSMDHPVLKDLLVPIRNLYEDVHRKALMRLEYEGLHKAEAITTPGARFYNDPAGYAMERYAYYVCCKCKKAYYGGEARCDVEAGGGDDYDPMELVCGACSDVSRAQMCPKHGTDFLEYKCRYCCSVAVFFCFGTTHFCNACHDDFQRVTNIPKHELPHCPTGPKAKQLEGDECPLHVQHPPTGEEFALGCGVCRNAHTF